MTKEKTIQIANDLLQNKGDMSLWLEITSDYLLDNRIDKDKISNIIRMFPQLPDQIKIPIIKKCLDYYIHKLEICSLMKMEENVSMLFNGIPQKEYIPILYY